MEDFKDYFRDIDDALEQLVSKITQIDLSNTLILGLFREGSILSKRVAQHYGLPLEYFFVSSLNAPENEDCPIAFVSEKMDVVIDECLSYSFEISNDEIYEQAYKHFKNILLPKSKRLRGENIMTDFKDKDVLIVDEGVETGFRVELAVRACVKEKCKSVSLATPVLSKDMWGFFSNQCDRIYYVLKPEYFVSRAYYYQHTQF